MTSTSLKTKLMTRVVVNNSRYLAQIKKIKEDEHKRRGHIGVAI